MMMKRTTIIIKRTSVNFLSPAKNRKKEMAGVFKHRIFFFLAAFILTPP